MNWLQRMGLAAPPSPAHPEPVVLRQAQDEREMLPEPETTAHERALAKARRDVRRFTVAIEQCAKGEARLSVLRDDLARATRRLTMLEDL